MTARYCFIVASLLSATIVASDLLLDGGSESGWDTSKWRTQVDGVMGGKSSGALKFDDSETVMSFTGVIDLDGGGFSSVRKTNLNSILDLSGYAGIVVRLETVEGYDENDDGARQAPLALHLQLHDTSSRYGYASAFTVPLANASGLETGIFLPLDSFNRATRMGYRCNSCALDTSFINEIDIYVLFQKGPFRVRVKSITAVDIPQSFPSPVITISSSNGINDLVTGTINSGGSVYDYGYEELCISMYVSTLNTLLAASGDSVSDTLKGTICEGLNRAVTQSDRKEIAWTLRYTLDAILEELGFLKKSGDHWRPDVTNATALTGQCYPVTSFPPVTDSDVKRFASGDREGAKDGWFSVEASFSEKKIHFYAVANKFFVVSFMIQLLWL